MVAAGGAWYAFDFSPDNRSLLVARFISINETQPGKVDLEKVRTSLPHGIVTVKAVKGGLDVPDPEGNDIAVIASAAVAVRLELP